MLKARKGARGYDAPILHVEPMARRLVIKQKPPCHSAVEVIIHLDSESFLNEEWVEGTPLDSKWAEGYVRPHGE